MCFAPLKWSMKTHEGPLNTNEFPLNNEELCTQLKKTVIFYTKVPCVNVS